MQRITEYLGRGFDQIKPQAREHWIRAYIQHYGKQLSTPQWLVDIVETNAIQSYRADHRSSAWRAVNEAMNRLDSFADLA